MLFNFNFFNKLQINWNIFKSRSNEICLMIDRIRNRYAWFYNYCCFLWRQITSIYVDLFSLLHFFWVIIYFNHALSLVFSNNTFFNSLSPGFMCCCQTLQKYLMVLLSNLLGNIFLRIILVIIIMGIMMLRVAM